MAYTPINWQTGDTITAEKLNRCDNGWGTENTQLFSETVTTEAGEYGNEGQLAFSSMVSSSELTVTFDGTDYQCSAVELSGNSGYGYGGVDSELEYDFTTYPFAVSFTNSYGNILATETAGSHTVAASGSVTVTSSDFAAAVAVALPPELFVATANATTWQEVHDAVAAKKLAFVYEESGGNLYCRPVLAVTSGSGYEVATAIVSGGGVSAGYYEALTADGPIYAN